MINVKKILNPTVKKTDDLLKSIFYSVEKRKGYIDGKCPIVPVYFYRYIGLSGTYDEYLSMLNKLDNQLKMHGRKYICFKNKIDFKQDRRVIDEITRICKGMNEISIENVAEIVNQFYQEKLVPSVNGNLMEATLEKSLRYILKDYIRQDGNINGTKIKNFSCKILLWIQQYVPELVGEIDYRTKNTFNIINPKILYYGNIKKHEVYFLMLLTMLGCDVVYFNTDSDEEFMSVGNNSKSMMFTERCELKEWIENKKQDEIIDDIKIEENCGQIAEIKVATKQEEKEVWIDRLIPSLKKSRDMFKDIKTPMESRVGFKSGASPIIPNYFIRFIGIEENMDKYYNDLYRFDKTLLGLGKLYIRFDGKIEMENDISKARRVQGIFNDMKSLDESELDRILGKIRLEKEISVFEGCILEAFIQAMKEVIKVYLDNEVNVNTSKLKNFASKLILWSNQHGEKLFRDFDFMRDGKESVFNPKIIFYGDIKVHEAYFLTVMSRVGCDIIYINTENDRTIENIKGISVYSQVIDHEDRTELREFPNTEIALRAETVAYKASEQIKKMVFTDDGGMYKPWQLESYNIKHVTMKSTFEELRILWREPARFRNGFKVENQSVYIPNIFAKVSGTHADVNKFCEELEYFKSSETTKFIEQLPFFRSEFNKNELYMLMDIFDKGGNVEKSKIMKNKFYKYAHLKSSVQENIIEKMNMLIKMEMFQKPLEKNFILKVAMTLMNLDKDILGMIQTFDYPNNIPKLIIFHNDERGFSEGEAIILAFLNLMCFDILIYTPTGYNNIENRVLERYYDIHKLEKIDLSFNMNVFRSTRAKANSIFKGIFGRK